MTTSGLDARWSALIFGLSAGKNSGLVGPLDCSAPTVVCWLSVISGERSLSLSDSSCARGSASRLASGTGELSIIFLGLPFFRNPADGDFLGDGPAVFLEARAFCCFAALQEATASAFAFSFGSQVGSNGSPVRGSSPSQSIR